MNTPSTHAPQRVCPAPSFPLATSRSVGRARRNITLVASVVYVAAAGLAAWLAASLVLALCALSFWHYYLYALAYRYGAIPLSQFKRDAMLMKSVALLVLAWVYLAAPIEPASLAVVLAGFLLNAVAAAALGVDRTYYGHEVANLARLRVTRFPYSLIAHPMLVGNMLAYAGMLLNAEFRAAWWPLACAHVACNLGLLAMERYVTPLRLSAATATAGLTRPATDWSWLRWFGLTVAGAGLAGGVASITDVAPPLLAAGAGAAAMTYAFVLFYAYTRPAPVPVERLPTKEGLDKPILDLPACAFSPAQGRTRL